MLTTQHTEECLLFTLMIADREVQLVATAQHHQRVLYCTSLALEKTTVQNSKYNFC